MKTAFRRSALLCATLLGCDALQAQAQGFPSKPILAIVAGGTGTTLDTTLRLFTGTITQQTGHPFVIDYKAGASGTIGAAFVAKAPPDGHTLMAQIATYTIAPALIPNLPFDPIKDLAALTQMTGSSNILIINPSLPFRNLGEYLTHVKANPGKLNYGTTGQGSSIHMGGALLHYLAKADVTYIHYKVGSQRTADFLAGRLDVTLASPRNYADYVKQGKARGLGVTSTQRMDSLPDMPTIAEQGVPGYEYSTWTGVFAPGRTPQATMGQLHKWFVDAGKDAALVKKLGAAEQDIVTSTPAAFAKKIATEIPRWREVVKAANITVD